MGRGTLVRVGRLIAVVLFIALMAPAERGPILAWLTGQGVTVEPIDA